MYLPIDPAEACALLDHVLQTVQSLDTAFARYFPKVPVSVEAQPPASLTSKQIHREIEAELTVSPVERRPAVPVLTIKLSDLIREAERAKNHRQFKAPAQQRRPWKHKRRHRHPATDVEVVYRKGFRVA